MRAYYPSHSKQRAWVCQFYLKKNLTYLKNVDKIDAILLKCLSYNAVTVDELIEKTNFSPQIITRVFLLLELENKVAKIIVSGYALIK
ncbi:hypothetical protein [Candidatus Ruthia magnifica]|uniref:DprA-like winged helix domain-containing protein n=1 Tax=Candidatus Ruthturnera calyptogenae TaxID=386487 RepID=UPI0004656340